MSNFKFKAASSLCFLSAMSITSAHAAGMLAQSWRTENGWLTELRVHPDGAKVCSTGKASTDPHSFGITFIRSGTENVLLLADQQQPPTVSGQTEMTFVQGGKTVGELRVETAGPAWISTIPAGGQATSLTSRLAAGPLTIKVANRDYQIDLAGLPDALSQLNRCATAAQPS